MAFGQPSGPPASAKQLKQLLTLLEAAGYSDFRDARGPMGFNQRQGGGKFTKDEADGFITALEFAAEQGDGATAPTDEPAAPAAPPVARRPASTTTSAAQQTLRRFPSELLAAELQRRGWVVMEP
ncbi:unannotated protein [freshwater metagenome]|uniref:Unannotated protein n=1 Tax=freshwater metagenome TaxID=449393 RepID=A0A6J7E8P2_9ZZZZ